MSIINQALQKAQRAQLGQSQQEMAYLLPLRLAQASRRLWLWLSLGLAVAVGLGAILHAWIIAPAARQSVAGLPATATRPITQAPPQTSAAPPAVHNAARPMAEPSRAPGTPAGDALVARVAVAPTATAGAPVPATPVPRVTPTTPPAVASTTMAPAPDLPALPSTATPTSLEIKRAQALAQRAVTAQEAGELTLASSLLEQAVKLDPTAKATYNSLGNVYYQQRRYQQAVAVYNKALALDPDYAKARNNLGSTYMKLAMDKRAIEELQRALRADSSYSLTYYNLACVYARGGDGTTAAQYLRQAIALEPQARTWAQADADFAPVRSAPAMQQLLGPQ